MKLTQDITEKPVPTTNIYNQHMKLFKVYDSTLLDETFQVETIYAAIFVGKNTFCLAKEQQASHDYIDIF